MPDTPPDAAFTPQMLLEAFIAGAAWARDEFDPDMDGRLTAVAFDAFQRDYPDFAPHVVPLWGAL